MTDQPRQKSKSRDRKSKTAAGQQTPNPESRITNDEPGTPSVNQQSSIANRQLPVPPGVRRELERTARLLWVSLAAESRRAEREQARLAQICAAPVGAIQESPLHERAAELGRRLAELARSDREADLLRRQRAAHLSEAFRRLWIARFQPFEQRSLHVQHCDPHSTYYQVVAGREGTWRQFEKLRPHPMWFDAESLAGLRRALEIEAAGRVGEGSALPAGAQRAPLRWTRAEWRKFWRHFWKTEPLPRKAWNDDLDEPNDDEWIWKAVLEGHRFARVPKKRSKVES
jgi:hypothetical protein